MGLDRRETGLLLFDGSVLLPEGKDPLVREERGFAASSQPVVRQGMQGSHAVSDKG